MSEPYYQDDLVTLYHGDCRKVTAWLDADVLVTDPPYGRAWKQGDTCKLRGWVSDRHAGILNDVGTLVRDEALDLWGERPAVVFGDLMLSPPPGTKHVLVYDKGDEAGFMGAIGGYRRNAEGIYLLGKHPSGLGGSSCILRGHGGGNLARTTGHPHTKPVDLMAQLVTNTLGAIADPFVGSGSTLLAAKYLGRKAIGVEVEERYCEIAAKRLAQDTLFEGVA